MIDQTRFKRIPRSRPARYQDVRTGDVVTYYMANRLSQGLRPKSQTPQAVAKRQWKVVRNAYARLAEIAEEEQLGFNAPTFDELKKTLKKKVTFGEWDTERKRWKLDVDVIEETIQDLLNLKAEFDLFAMYVASRG